MVSAAFPAAVDGKFLHLVPENENTMIQNIDEPDSGDEAAVLLPARMLNEYVYCPRLFWLEFVDGLFAHNRDTVEGAIRHRRVDGKTDELPAAGSRKRKRSDKADAAEDPPREVLHARSVTLGSERHGVLAKLDLVEADGWKATPVDYKRGSPRRLADESLVAWDPERVQLCVQALVLRENGYQCDEGVVFYWETRQRIAVPITPELLELTNQAIDGARQLVSGKVIPPPLVDSPKCPRCSLVGICLPDETNACRSLGRAHQKAVQPLLFSLGLEGVDPPGSSTCPRTPIRPLVTARDDKRPLYLNSQGMSVGKSGEVLQIRERDQTVQEIRLHDLNQVNLFGSIQITTQAVQTLLEAELPLLYFSMGGWFYGMTQSVGLKNILWRREQFRRADEPAFCLQTARQLVAGKIRNQRILLMRNHVSPPAEAILFLKNLVDEADRAGGLDVLLGIEGYAARVYFSHFAGMIKTGRAEDPERAPWDPEDGVPAWLGFDFQGRNRRPPRDPVNALLSLGYSLLAKDLTVTCAAVGLDPYLGFYHQPRHGRPALALDLMEPFRPLIVDSAVLTAINTRMVQQDHFMAAGQAVALTPEGRKAFFRAYEQRMDQLVTHPMFDYRVSYRRMLEIQTRLLARVITGELREYPPFVTR